MVEPEIIQEQRNLLHALETAAQESSVAMQQANYRRRQQTVWAQSALTKLQGRDTLGEETSLLEQARRKLAGAEMWALLDQKIDAADPAASLPSGSGALPVLNKMLDEAEQVVQDLSLSVDELLRWRRRLFVRLLMFLRLRVLLAGDIPIINAIEKRCRRLGELGRLAEGAHAACLREAANEHERTQAKIADRYNEQMQMALRTADQARLEYESIAANCKGWRSDIDDSAIDNMSAGIRPTASDEDIGGQPDLLTSVWIDADWEWWCPSRQVMTPELIRLGMLREKTQWDTVAFPALLPVIGAQNVFFVANGAAKISAMQALQSALLRLLATIPPGQLQFTFIDPVGLGENVAAFMHLADYDEQLVNGKAWTETQHIEQRLADLTRHMENVIQKYLRNQYASIEEYNEKAGEIAEPYRVLVVANFPAGFSDTAARNLVSIMQNGPRCGVYTLILVDTALKLPYNFELDELKRGSTLIEWNGERFVWQDEDFASCTLELDTPPGNALFDRILTAVGTAAKKGTRVEVPFEKLFEMLPLQVQKFAGDYPGLSPEQLPALDRPETWWRGSTELRLIAPLGRAGANKVQCLDLRDNIAPHVLVAGRTGSGKSTLLHVIILSLALTYGPEEIELYLIDFKKGVEFKTYATHHLPHARVIAIESEREFGLSVLRKLDEEMARRGELFRGIDKGGIATYRKRSGETLPRVFLLVDEFQEFFTEDDAISSRAAQILDRLARQGRSFGMHVLLGSQTLAGNYALARSTMDQMGVRIALQCSEADSRLILGEENPQARLLSRPGEAIYNDDNCQVEGNDFFQVAWLPDEQREALLRSIEARARDTRAREPYVFEGNVPADVSHVDPFALRRSIPSALVPVWLGDPIAIKDPVAACFRRQGGSNLLIVGQQEEAALGMLAVALTSLSLGFGAPRTEADWQHPIQVLDFGVDGPHAGFFATLAGHLHERVQVARRRQLPEVIDRFASEVQRRLDAEDDAQPATARRESLFLVIHGLQRARDLRQDASFGMSSYSSYGSEPAPPNSAQQFMSILRDGPEVGIHTIVWCDTMTNLNRSLDRRALREFALRVASQMSAEDSSNLIDSPAASKLGPNRALFYSEEEGMLEKFRPYGLPPSGWYEQVAAQLAPGVSTAS